MPGLSRAKSATLCDCSGLPAQLCCHLRTSFRRKGPYGDLLYVDGLNSMPYAAAGWLHVVHSLHNTTLLLEHLSSFQTDGNQRCDDCGGKCWRVLLDNGNSPLGAGQAVSQKFMKNLTRASLMVSMFMFI